jgi:hypothetical protein
MGQETIRQTVVVRSDETVDVHVELDIPPDGNVVSIEVGTWEASRRARGADSADTFSAATCDWRRSSGSSRL